MTNLSPNLVTKLVITKFDTLFGDKFVTKFGDTFVTKVGELNTKFGAKYCDKFGDQKFGEKYVTEYS